MEPPTEFKEVAEYIHSNMAKRGEEFYTKFSNLDKMCYKSAADNVDIYVKCMSKLTKSVNYHENLLRYKTEYLKTKTFKCMVDGKGNKNIMNDCKKEAKTKFDQFIKEFNDILK